MPTGSNQKKMSTAISIKGWPAEQNETCDVHWLSPPRVQYADAHFVYNRIIKTKYDVL